MTTIRRGALLASLFSAALLFGSAAHAQTPSELDKARTLFREGVALSAANDWAGALAKFKGVAQVKMTPQVAFNIAECEEHLGKLLSALGNYRLAASEAEAAKAKDVAAQVDERIAAIEARIPKLVILRGEGADTARIELDGVELGATQLGGELPVDPGPHVIVGKVGGTEASRDTVDLEEKQVRTISVVIDLEMMKKPEKPVETPEPIEKPAEPEEGPSRTLAYAVGGAGIGVLGLGVVFMILRSGAISDLDAVCTSEGSCPKDAESTADSGKLYTGLAEVTIPLGAVGVAAGVYLYLNSGGEPPPTSVETGLSKGSRVGFVTTAPGADVAGASLVGSF